MTACQKTQSKLFSGCKIHRYTLRNIYGWVVTYETVDEGPDYNTVRIVRSYKGEREPDLLVTREQARAHYRALTQQGFVNKLTTI